MELCKLAAAVFVVLIHCRFPGNLGRVMDCLARFAVPLFFAISGSFSLGADERKLRKRFFRILRLELAASALYLAWRCLLAVSWGGNAADALLSSLPDGGGLLQWLLLSCNPFAGHLWYLSALALCYGVIWCYVNLFGQNYRPLYLTGAILLTLHLILGEFAGMLGFVIDFRLYRSGILFGLPMFLLGMALKQYGQRLWTRLNLTPRKLWLVILAGAALSLVQKWTLGMGELPLGTLAEVAALLLLLMARPVLTTSPEKSRRIERSGRMSATVYILHLLILEGYERFFLLGRESVMETWLRPVVIIVLSLLAAALWDWVHGLTKQNRKVSGGIC